MLYNEEKGDIELSQASIALLIINVMGKDVLDNINYLQ